MNFFISNTTAGISIYADENFGNENNTVFCTVIDGKLYLYKKRQSYSVERAVSFYKTSKGGYVCRPAIPGTIGLDFKFGKTPIECDSTNEIMIFDLDFSKIETKSYTPRGANDKKPVSVVDESAAVEELLNELRANTCGIVKIIDDGGKFSIVIDKRYTVETLIEELQKHSPKAPVVFSHNGNFYYNLEISQQLNGIEIAIHNAV